MRLMRGILGVLIATALVVWFVPAATWADDWDSSPVVAPIYVNAIGDNAISVSDCNSGQSKSAPGHVFIRNGVKTYGPGYIPYTSSSVPVEIQCTPESSTTLPDGTFVTSGWAGGSNNVVTASKNGRYLWQKNITVCSGSSSPYGLIAAVEMGHDGILYAIIRSEIGSCASHFVGLDPTTGDIETDITLTVESPNYVQRVYTYDDEMIIVNGKHIYRTDYDWSTTSLDSDDNTTLNGLLSNYIWANQDKDLFVQYISAGPCAYKSHVMVVPEVGSSTTYDVDSTTGLCDGPYYWNTTILPDGGTAAAEGNTVTKYNDGVTTPPSLSSSPPSGYHDVPLGIVSDVNGNLIVRSIRERSSPYDAYPVVLLYDFGSSSVNTVWDSRIELGTTSPVQQIFSATNAADSIFGDYMYMGTCVDWCPSDFSTAKIQKIELTGWGDEFQTTGNFDPVSSTQLKYVAMGDSYAAGQGNAPYLYGSDTGSNVCHRSSEAWPLQVEQDLLSELDLTAFVACSGAVSADITNVNSVNVELPQAVSIAPDTDLVTVSIGGNDIGFAETIGTCVASTTAQDCIDALDGADSLATDPSFISSLENTFETIGLLGSEDTEVLVVGYPALYPEYDDVSGSCSWGTTAEALAAPDKVSGRAITEAEFDSLRQVHDDLNLALNTAVTNLVDADIHFVDPTAMFSGHEICGSSDDWLNEISLQISTDSLEVGSFHPNAAGMAGYASFVETQIGVYFP